MSRAEMPDGAATTAAARAQALSLLTAADPARVKAEAEALAPGLGRIEVIQCRTGLVMLPYRDTAQGAAFYLGEVLVAQAHIRCPDQNAEGYAVVLGRDLEHAMAVAVLDAAGAASAGHERLEDFLSQIRATQTHADEARRRDVEATRVQMETF